MALVTVSQTGEVTVPRDVAEKAGLGPGQRLAALAIGSHVTLVPVRPLPAVLGVTRAGAAGRRAGPADGDSELFRHGPPRIRRCSMEIPKGGRDCGAQPRGDERRV
jgi:bifunctional DNA-binding transcriptional regulator/antitoxin component of YhaV-PrlF toxin-antitoxin module